MARQRLQKTDFEDLFRYWYRPLCVYALHYTEDTDLAEDIVQECYMSLWERTSAACDSEGGQGRCAMPKNPRSYLYSMVRNRCIDHIRSRRTISGEGIPLSVIRETEMSAGDDGLAQQRDGAAGSMPGFSPGLLDDEALQEDSVTEARLWTAIDSLPDKCREIFLMAKRDGLRYEEIASEGSARLSISSSACRAETASSPPMCLSYVSPLPPRLSHLQWRCLYIYLIFSVLY